MLGHCLACADPATLLFFFAHTYGGNIAVEAFYSAILILLMIGGLLCCFKEKLSNVLFYFSSGFATWYISDRLFLVTASICRLNSSLVPYFTERTPSHILLYITCFLAVYLFIYFTVGKKDARSGGQRDPHAERAAVLAAGLYADADFLF